MATMLGFGGEDRLRLDLHQMDDETLAQLERQAPREIQPLIIEETERRIAERNPATASPLGLALPPLDASVDVPMRPEPQPLRPPTVTAPQPAAPATGLGLATPPAAAQPAAPAPGLGMATPPAPQPIPAPTPAKTAASEGGFFERAGSRDLGGTGISFEKNPIAAIGLVLTEFAAGVKGKPSPAAGMRKERQVERQQRLQEAQAQLDAIGKIQQIAAKVPAASREQFAQQVSQPFGLNPKLVAMALNEPGNPAPTIMTKLGGTAQIAADALPQAREFLDKDFSLSVEDALTLNAKLPDGDPRKLNDAETAYLRSKEGEGVALSLGLMTPDIQKELAKQRLKPDDIKVETFTQGDQEVTQIIRVRDGKVIKELGRGPKKPLVEVNTGDTLKTAAAKAFGAEQAKDIIEERKKAQDAVSLLRTNSDLTRLLNEGIRTGFGAELRNQARKLLLEAGVETIDERMIANTEAFMATAGRAVAKIIQDFGAGTGLSDADREFAANMAGGNIAVTEEGLRRILDMSRRAAKTTIDDFNRRAQRIPEELTLMPMTIDLPPDLAGESSPETFDTRPRRRWTPERGLEDVR